MILTPDHSEDVQRWLLRLEQLHPSDIELGLDRVLLVFRRLLPRHWSPRVITVAGTNGKGSTVRVMESLLRHGERSVGAYLSPHINRFNERIHINGEEVADRALLEAFEAVEAARRETPLTYFEFATLAALWLFHRQQVQDLVLEVGLGGRLDAVNIMDPDLAIITSVDLDHTDWLGDDREAIGAEKAGILRPGIKAVYGEPDPPLSVMRQAQAQSVDLRVARTAFDFDAQGLRLTDGHNNPIRLAWSAPAPPTPAQLMALQALAMLGDAPDQELVQVAQQSQPLPGRFEQLHRAPTVIADVGHNPHAARWLAHKLAHRKAAGGQIKAVYGALADKDASGVMEAMAPIVDRWYLSSLEGPRGRQAQELAQLLEETAPGTPMAIFDGVQQALGQAFGDASDDDLILVFGSFLMVAEARRFLDSDGSD